MLDLPILIKKIRIDFISKFVLKLEISSSMPKNYCKLGKKIAIDQNNSISIFSLVRNEEDEGGSLT